MSTDNEIVPVGFSFPRPDRRAIVVGLGASQLAVLAIAGLFAITALLTIPNLAGLSIAVVLFAVAVPAVTVTVRGRRLDEWAPVLVGWRYTRLRGTNAWRAPVAPAQTGHATPAAIAPPPLAHLRILRVTLPSHGPVAVLHDRAADTWTAVVSCSGRAFVLLDTAEQHRLTGQWGDLLASFASGGSPVQRITWVEQAVPETGDALTAHLDRHGVLDGDDPVHLDYQDLIWDAGPISQRHDTHLAVTIGRRHARRAIDDAGGGDPGACKVVLSQATSLVERLGYADITCHGICDPTTINRFFRRAYDPGTLAGQGSGDTAATGPVPWPVATRTEWDSYRTDSGVHATYRIHDWPRRTVTADHLAPLLLADLGHRRIAVVMEPVPPQRAFRAVESAHASHLADEQLRRKAGWLPTARRTRDHEAILTREAELADGHAELIFVATITLTAESTSDLERQCRHLEQVALDSMLDLRRCYGQQDAAFTWTLPLGRGLPRTGRVPWR